jgi:hypothetical protein
MFGKMKPSNNPFKNVIATVTDWLCAALRIHAKLLYPE